jgi:sulfite exporter TauE/SafE
MDDPKRGQDTGRGRGRRSGGDGQGDRSRRSDGGRSDSGRGDRSGRSGGERPNPDTQRLFGLIILALAIFLLAQGFGFSRVFNSFPIVSEGAGYAMLFVIGLLTSLHCVAMCGGINLSQTIARTEDEAGRLPEQAADRKAGRGRTTESGSGRGGATGPGPGHGQSRALVSKAAALRPSALYNLGRVVSYTLVGALVGALGSVIAFDGFFKGIVQLAAGVFMVVMALILLGIFPWLRQFNITPPKALTSFVNKRREHSRSPLVIGLLNGLMPCGPLQAMQLYALSTGSVLAGALSMLAFSLGTVPLMFGLGALGSLLSKRFRQRATAAGAVLVAVLGFFMFSTGWNLSGFADPLDALRPTSTPIVGQVVVEDGYQLVSNALEPGAYPDVKVQVGLPVKWKLSATEDSINGCNNRIFIPEYGIEYALEPGDNIIEFTPTEPGRYTYTCWMGMIRGTIDVTDA